MKKYTAMKTANGGCCVQLLGTLELVFDTKINIRNNLRRPFFYKIICLYFLHLNLNNLINPTTHCAPFSNFSVGVVAASRQSSV